MSPSRLPLRPAHAAVPLLYALLTLLQLVVPALGLGRPGGGRPGPPHRRLRGRPSTPRTPSTPGRATRASSVSATRDRAPLRGQPGRGGPPRRLHHGADRPAGHARGGHPPLRRLRLPAQETGGGRNVFGHDPTVFAGAGKVTRSKYLAYKHVRQRTGEMQGVGPMQLTWWSYQDRADRLGGAWKPYPNMLVGFRHLAELHHATGSWTAGRPRVQRRRRHGRRRTPPRCRGASTGCAAPSADAAAGPGTQRCVNHPPDGSTRGQLTAGRGGPDRVSGRCGARPRATGRGRAAAARAAC